MLAMSYSLLQWYCVFLVNPSNSRLCWKCEIILISLVIMCLIMKLLLLLLFLVGVVVVVVFNNNNMIIIITGCQCLLGKNV